MTYDITKDTYCLYCQEDKKTPAKLRAHLRRKHKDTYAQIAMDEKWPKK